MTAAMNMSSAVDLIVYCGQSRLPDDVVLGLARPGEVGVFLVPEDGQVPAEQARDEAREQELVDDEQPREEAPVPGKAPAPDVERQPGADERDATGRSRRRPAGRNPKAGRRAASSRRSPRAWRSAAG